MLKKLRKPVMLLGTALMLFGPVAAFARDHDRDDWRHERRESREHEWREHHRRDRGYGSSYYYSPSYANGYYDRWGYWHPYANGYYDRWGYFHPYGY